MRPGSSSLEIPIAFDVFAPLLSRIASAEESENGRCLLRDGRRHADKWIFEDRLERNPPRSARAYALIAAVMYDTFIATQDGKFAYWYLRPHQLDPAIVPVFAVPNFPSYPSDHSSFAVARCTILGYLFPAHAEFIRAVGREAGDSRIWAGIHYPMDHVAGVQLGRSIAQLFISWAEGDGSQ